MKQATIFLTGATGSVGTQLIQKLASADVHIKALVRPGSDTAHLRRAADVEIISADLADPSGYEMALHDVDKAFLLTNSSEDAERLQIGFAEAARRAGVKHIVKLSQFAASEYSPVRFLRYHARVENRIRAMGMTYTFLRPNLYMQGLLAFKDYIKDNGHFFASVGQAAVSAIDVRDIAAVAAACLAETGHENKIYNLTGPEALTHYQFAEIFSQVLGRPVQFIDVTPEQMKGGLQAAGFPEWQVGGLLEDYAHYARGEAATVADTVERVTGKKASSFTDFAADYRAALLH